MRARSSFLVWSVLALSAVPARADDREAVLALQDIRLRARAGEHARKIDRVEKGDELVVLRTKGRWLRVRYGTRVGWVTRTQVGESAPEPRPRARVTTLPRKRDKQAAKIVSAPTPRPRTAPQPRTASIDDVNDDEDPVTIRERRSAPARSDLGAVSTLASPQPRVRAALVATAGAQTLMTRQVSGADAAETRAITVGTLVSASGGVHARVAGAVWLGVGTSAELGNGELTYSSVTERSPPIAASDLAVDGFAEIGWGTRWMIAARGGVHYSSRSIDSDRVEPMLVGEQVRGAIVGVRGTVPFGGRVTLSAAVDAMPGGVQRPSELPEGMLYATRMRGAWARSTVIVRLPAHLVAALSYRGGLISAALTDGSSPANARRTDQSHAVTAGLGVSF